VQVFQVGAPPFLFARSRPGQALECLKRPQARISHPFGIVVALRNRLNGPARELPSLHDLPCFCHFTQA